MLKVYERVIRWLPARLQWLVDAASVGTFSGVVEVRTVFLSTRTVVRITHPFHVVRKERGDHHALVSNLAKSCLAISVQRVAADVMVLTFCPNTFGLKVQPVPNSIRSNSIRFNSIEINSIEFGSIQFNRIQFNSIEFNSI